MKTMRALDKSLLRKNLLLTIPKKVRSTQKPESKWLCLWHSLFFAVPSEREKSKIKYKSSSQKCHAQPSRLDTHCAPQPLPHQFPEKHSESLHRLTNTVGSAR